MTNLHFKNSNINTHLQFVIVRVFTDVQLFKIATLCKPLNHFYLFNSLYSRLCHHFSKVVSSNEVASHFLQLFSSRTWLVFHLLLTLTILTLLVSFKCLHSDCSGVTKNQSKDLRKEGRKEGS